ncbi:hypothetical protein CPB85DRAFT_1266193 [Mucidula mucida]|nr:hypothetical protein CPB85DRAFT_1266193 [Mucidula mucida]
MPPDRQPLHPKFRSLSQLATIIVHIPTSTIIVPETARSSVLWRRVHHPYAHAYAATHPLMRTIKHNEQVDWGTPPPLYERAVFNWNEQEPVEPQQLRAVRVVFDWDEPEHVEVPEPQPNNRRPHRLRRLATYLTHFPLRITRRLRMARTN